MANVWLTNRFLFTVKSVEWNLFLCIRYITIETKEAAILYVTVVFFRMNTQVKVEVRMRKKTVLSNTDDFFCFNSNVSNLYKNDVIIYKIKEEWWEQFCLWTCLPNFPITTLVKFLSSLIKRTANNRPLTAAVSAVSNSGL